MDGQIPNVRQSKIPVVGSKPPQKPARLATVRGGNAKQRSPQKVPAAATLRNGDSKKLERHVMTVLECPVCLEYMAPPIFMCANGHNLCRSCLAKCREVCPTCEVPIDSRRNLALEQLSVSSLYPCTYSNRGCTERLPALEKLSHERRCAYRPLSCPLVCGWRGSRDDLLSHVTMSHPDSYSVVNPDLPHFIQSVSQSDCFRDHRHAVFAFGETFAYIRRFSMAHRKMHLAVLLLGDPAEASNYRYKFKITKDDGDQYKSMSLVCSVHSYDEALDTVFLRSCITLDFETLVFYGNGQHSMKISKVPPSSTNKPKSIKSILV